MANKPLLMRVPDRQRDAWTRAAAAVGQSLIDWVKDVADQAAAGPGRGPGGVGEARPLKVVPEPRAAAGGGGVKGPAVPHGPNCACLSCRAGRERGPETRTVWRCSQHHALESDGWPECDAQCQAEWKQGEGAASANAPEGEGE